SHAPPAVRRAAASALVRANPERSIPLLIRALGADDASVRDAVADGLGQAGPPALARTVTALADPALETGALHALEHLPAHQATPSIREHARSSLARALYYHELARGIGGQDDRAELLAASLRDKAQECGLTALRAIALLGDRSSILVAIENLASRSPGQRANALETLESVGERSIIRPLLQVWEVTEAAPSESGDGVLRALRDPDSWLRACAALAARDLGDPPTRAALGELAQSDPDSVVREAAASALDGSQAPASHPALSRMERILFLRRVPLFADLAPADLKRVSAIAAERSYPDGATIARQGDLGDEMYIVVSGEIRVLARPDGGHESELARRKAGEYVGEMAIISQAPRMASLVTAGETCILCIAQGQFEQLLRERPEPRLAVMRMLCARLREKR
ncbi:MAG: HEAT repeat domain-containing protein, partial [Anaerolineales bacterium]